MYICSITYVDIYTYTYINIYIHFRSMLWNDFFRRCKAESKNWCPPGRGSTSSAQGSGDHRTTTATRVFTTKCTAGSAGGGGGIGHCDFPLCFKRSTFQTQNSLLFSKHTVATLQFPTLSALDVIFCQHVNIPWLPARRMKLFPGWKVANSIIQWYMFVIFDNISWYLFAYCAFYIVGKYYRRSYKVRPN